MILDLVIPENNANHTVSIGGRMEVLQKLYGPMDLTVEVNKCTLDLKTCEKVITINVKSLCSKIKDSNMFYALLLSRVVPPLNCPLNPGNYTVHHTEVDLSPFTYVPFDGFLFNFIVKILTTNPKTKARIIAICFQMEFKILKTRVKS
jgi:hypothetical protein